MQNRFYSITPKDKGTLFQLKQVVNRTSFGKTPKHNMKAAEDFLEVVLFAHVIAAAEEVMKHGNMRVDCEVVADSIVNNFVRLSIPTNDEPASNSDTNEPASNSDADEPASDSETCSSNEDSVYAYAADYLMMALLWHGFHDSIKMGDGNRILSYWKFLTAIFRQTGHHNYAKEGFFMLAQSHLMSNRRSTEMKWSRTVNTHGRAGHNIPVDLHMEQPNRRLKGMMRGLGSNITPESIQQTSKALGLIETVCSNFEEVSNITPNKDYHSMPSFENDLQKLKEQLVAEEVFVIKEGRHHQGFSKHDQLLPSIDWKKMTEWAKEEVLNYDPYCA